MLQKYLLTLDKGMVCYLGENRIYVLEFMLNPVIDLNVLNAGAKGIVTSGEISV